MHQVTFLWQVKLDVVSGGTHRQVTDWSQTQWTIPGVPTLYNSFACLFVLYHLFPFVLFWSVVFFYVIITSFQISHRTALSFSFCVCVHPPCRWCLLKRMWSFTWLSWPWHWTIFTAWASSIATSSPKSKRARCPGLPHLPAPLRVKQFRVSTEVQAESAADRWMSP